MKKLFFILLVLFFFQTIAFGVDYSLFGNIKMLAAYHYFPDLDPINEFSGNLSFTGNHRINLNAGDFFVHHRLSLNEQVEFSHDLYEAYLYMMPFDKFGFSLGKQRVNWGTSYVFSPSDRMHPSSGILDQETGFPGIALFFPITADINITGCMGMEDIIENRKTNFWEDIRYGINSSFLFGKLEIFGSFVYQWDKILLPGTGISYDLFGFIIAAEAAIEFNNQILYPENQFIWEQKEFGKPFFYLDIAVEKIFSGDNFSIFLINEYLYRQAGYTDDEAEYFYNVLASESIPESLSLEDTIADNLLRKHYFYFSLGYEYYNLLSFENSILMNLQDASFISSHKLTFIKLDSIDFYTEVFWSYGNNNTEFGYLQEKLKIETGAVVHF